MICVWRPVVGHDPRNIRIGGSFEQSVLRALRRKDAQSDDQCVLTLEGLDNGFGFVVVDFCDFDTVGQLGFRILASDGRYVVFACFK